MRDKALYLVDSALLDIQRADNRAALWLNYDRFTRLIHPFEYVGILFSSDAEKLLERGGEVLEARLAELP